MTNYGLLIVTSPDDESLQRAHSNATKYMPLHVSAINGKTHSFKISGETGDNIVDPPFLWVNRNVFKGWCKRQTKEGYLKFLQISQPQEES